MTPDVSVVIVSYNTTDLLRACLKALRDTAGALSLETFVVDNNSPDGSAAMVATEFPDVRLIANGSNVGFARANNQAIARAEGRLLLLLNPDAECRPGAMVTMARYLDEHPDVGAVGPKLLYPNGAVQPNGRVFPSPWREFIGHSGLRRFNPGRFNRMMEYGRDDFEVKWETDYVMGSCIMTRRAVMEQAGMLDEDFFMYYEEVEWCWRVRRAGYRIVYLPAAVVVHHHMASARQNSRAMTARLYHSMRTYYRKTAGLPEQAFATIVSVIGLLRNEVLHAGVAVKRRLRAAGLVR